MTQRILFMGEAVTLAHVARCRVLAEGLAARGYTVAVACDARYRWVLQHSAIEWLNLPSIPEAQFAQAINSGSPIYSNADMLSYAETDLQLLSDWKADVVVGDFRLSLVASARKLGIPYYNIINAYWSPWVRNRVPVPDLPMTRLLGPLIAQQLFTMFRPLISALHTRPLNHLLRHYGMQPLPADTRHSYTHSDVTLCADLPQLYEMRNMPSHQHFIGPIHWAPDLPLPAALQSLSCHCPIVYLNLGSSGDVQMLDRMILNLATLPIQLIVATAGRLQHSRFPDNVSLHDFLPGDKVAAMADLVICNGGSPSTFQALAYGVPIIGLPSNLDQFFNMQHVLPTGAAISLRRHRRLPQMLTEAVNSMLAQPGYRQAARKVADDLLLWRPAEQLATLI